MLQGGRPIVFESKKLSLDVRKYNTRDQELAVVVHAMRR